MSAMQILVWLIVLFVALALLAGAGAWLSYYRVTSGLRWPVHLFAGVMVVWLGCSAILAGMVLGRFFIRV
jgi:hypothetical protein